MIYLLLVYLDFPYLFYGRKCCNRNGFGHCFFTPVTGVWYPILRRVFNSVAAFILLSNFACIFLVLMWIALGVVVNPTLAVPYATGIVVFFTNFVNVKNSLINWQQLVVDEVLEHLVPFLNSLLDHPNFCDAIKEATTEIVTAVKNSSESNDAAASSMRPLLKVLNSFNENLSNDGNKPVLRKFKESEIAVLLRSLWHSIREELGLSARNVFIAVISSSLVLGLLLLFIFVGKSTPRIYVGSFDNIQNSFAGVSVFAQTNDPFATIVNSLLTIGAGFGSCLREHFFFVVVDLRCSGVNSNVDKGASSGESSAFHRRV
jgi:hypothetical protein